MKKRFVVYTAIFGKRDPLREDFAPDPESDHVCFTDDESLRSGKWEIRVIPNVSKPRMAARRIKALSHELFPDYEATLWVDATLTPTVPTRVLFEGYLKNSDVAVHAHYHRDCVYEEIKTCIDLKRGNRKKLEQQEKDYRTEGIPENEGLFESGALLRRHSPAVKHLNDAWMEEIDSYGTQDQISLTAVARRLKTSVSLLPNTVRTSPYFIFRGHEESFPIMLRNRGLGKFMRLRAMASQRLPLLLVERLRRTFYRNLVSKEPPTGRRISIWIADYNDQSILEKHFQEWRNYPETIKKAIDIIIVDDASETPPKIPEDLGVNIRLYRIEKDIPWNISGAKNLIMENSRTPWVLLLDINQTLPAEAASALLRVSTRSPRTIFRLSRDFPTGPLQETRKFIKKKPYDAATYFMNRQTFLLAGGFDEDLSGYYGHQSTVLNWHLENNLACRNIHLPQIRLKRYSNQRSESDEDFARSRNSERNAEILKKSKRRDYAPGPRLRFPWKLVREYNPRADS